MCFIINDYSRKRKITCFFFFLSFFLSLFLIETFQEPFVAVCLSIYIALTSLNERENVLKSVQFYSCHPIRFVQRQIFRLHELSTMQSISQNDSSEVLDILPP
jgi:hypothetical protein